MSSQGTGNDSNLLRRTAKQLVQVRLIWGTSEGEQRKNTLQAKLDPNYGFERPADSIETDFFTTKGSRNMFAVYPTSTDEIKKTLILIKMERPSAVVVCDQASLLFLIGAREILKNWLAPNVKLITLGFEPDLSRLKSPFSKAIINCAAGASKTQFLAHLTNEPAPDEEAEGEHRASCALM
jgi:hypothetical protein